MSLPTAPCTHCRQRVVYGQRRCPACGTTFDYGPAPPPEPTPAQVQEALMAADIQAQIQAQSGPHPAAPGVPAAPAAPAIRPPATARPAMASAYAPVSVPSGAPLVDDDFIDRGRYDEQSTAPVQVEDIPGFVDSTLFKAFTPDVVETEVVDGLELSPGAAARPRPAKKRADPDEGPQPCRDCGTRHERSVCPACGARR